MRVINLPLTAITPNSEQHRQDFKDIEGVAASIKAMGILQPLVVRRTGEGTFALVTGERRYRAATLAGLSEVPCILSESEGVDAKVEELVTNLHVQRVNPIEEGRGFRAIGLDLGGEGRLLAHRVAGKVSKPEGYVFERMRLASLPQVVVEYVQAGAFTVKELDALASLLFAPDNCLHPNGDADRLDLCCWIAKARVVGAKDATGREVWLKTPEALLARVHEALHGKPAALSMFDDDPALAEAAELLGGATWRGFVGKLKTAYLDVYDRENKPKGLLGMPPQALVQLAGELELINRQHRDLLKAVRTAQGFVGEGRLAA